MIPETCPKCGAPLEIVEFGYRLTCWTLMRHPDGTYEYTGSEGLDETKDSAFACNACSEDLPQDVQQEICKRIR